MTVCSEMHTERNVCRGDDDKSVDSEHADCDEKKRQRRKKTWMRTTPEHYTLICVCIALLYA